MSRARYTASQQIGLRRVLANAKQAAEAAGRFDLIDMLRMLRSQLRMTQKQVAKRAGLHQSHIAKIESGTSNVRVDTLNKVFNAMFCDMSVLPNPRMNLDEVVEKRVRDKARTEVQIEMGKMRERGEKADEHTFHFLLNSVVERLNRTKSPEIWD